MRGVLKVKRTIRQMQASASHPFYRLQFRHQKKLKINLCGGNQKIHNFINVDITPTAEVLVNLNKKLLPFAKGSVDTVVCTSAINYFSYERGLEIIKDIYRVLERGGICRMSVQDLELIANHYVNKNEKFFNQRLSDGSPRFPGNTYADKFNQWFYGYQSNGFPCRYFYDYNSLSHLFKLAGFEKIEKLAYLQSKLTNVDLIDNREDQMFFLEATK